MPHQQLALDVALRDDLDFDHFITGHNEELVSQLRKIAFGEASIPLIFVWGETGSGKTHLLNACYRASIECGGNPFLVDLGEAAATEHGEAALDGLEDCTVFCIDGLEAIAGIAHWEERLFQCCNYARDNQRTVILSATRPPTSLGMVLRDLLTRLMAGLTYQVLQLNDAQKISALQDRATHRGFELNESAAQYLLDRYHRQTGYLFDILDKLDRASLEQKRVITIPFLRSLKLE